jgi:hypothetical protein
MKYTTDQRTYWQMAMVRMASQSSGRRKATRKKRVERRRVTRVWVRNRLIILG